MVAVAVFLVFSMMFLSGDPVLLLMPPDASREEIAAFSKQMGFDQPFLVQFANFAGKLALGDFGMSWRFQEPALNVVLEKLPATIELAVASLMLSLLIAVPIGVISAVRKDSKVDTFSMVFALLGQSIPGFWLGLMLILVFAVWLRLLPSFGRGETVQIGWWTTNFLTWSGLKALILPSITLGLFQLTLLMRLVRSEMLEVMRADYIKFARARGLTNRAINFGHALKNTLVPVITVTGLQLGALIAFAIVTETVFAWPGVGQLFIQSVQFSDIPVMAAYLLLIGLLFVLINLTVDLLYFVVDPRLRSQGGAARVAGH